MNILGIESSCDETACAVVRDGREVLSNVVYTQIPLHRPYGGVVPEVASRAHIEKIHGVVAEAMRGVDALDAVAVTYGPGLASSLLVGLNAAKGLALALGVPLIGINHIEAHLHTPFLFDAPGDGTPPPAPEDALPALGLAVSGGHTTWVDMPDYGAYTIIGQTLDDAAGEAHDRYGDLVEAFRAAGRRFGTPEELKALIDQAHKDGIAVIMDIVHSHAVKNEMEGLGNLAGDPNQYFYPGERHEHPAWDSLCFDYGKDDVMHFLLSNCKYWMEEFRFDGFRFDGVTSMLYYSHGLGEAFCNYGDYFNGHQDDNAICYLTLANLLIHEVNPNAITIAEEVSGMPGLAAKFTDGGYGFDYRMAMNIPDYWIKTIKELPDEAWKPSSIFWEVTKS